MNDQDPGTAPAPQLSARLESAFELAARELLRERRSERRWRVFFRLVWLGLVLAVAWALLSQRMSMTAPATSAVTATSQTGTTNHRGSMLVSAPIGSSTIAAISAGSDPHSSNPKTMKTATGTVPPRVVHPTRPERDAFRGR